jgi:hypothetical protein
MGGSFVKPLKPNLYVFLKLFKEAFMKKASGVWPFTKKALMM